MITAFALVALIAAQDAPAKNVGQAAELQESRAESAAWTVAGATAAGFVGGALLAVPFMSALIGPLGLEIALAVGLPTLALGAAFGAFVAALGSARFSTSLAVSGIAGGGALLGTAAGMAAGFGIGTLAQTKANDPAPFLGAMVGGALGGIGGGARAGSRARPTRDREQREGLLFPWIEATGSIMWSGGSRARAAAVSHRHRRRARCADGMSSARRAAAVIVRRR